MAVRAGHNLSCWRQLVRTRQWPTRRAVIKGGSGPGNCVVTHRTVRRGKGRARRGVCWIICGLPGRQMALRVSAIRRRNRQAVIVVDVAGSARRYFPGGGQLVRVRQRETRGSVIEC